ncbi:MAG: crtB 3 [Verrucomicrobiales bacterium]|nr:crtB 3 [Verrucomicrobiales bacterium]
MPATGLDRIGNPSEVSTVSEDSPDFDRPLQGPLLAAVSRSFYLSLRFLPPPVRGPLSISYLMARAADTVADVTASPAPERLELLERFRSALTDGPTPDFLLKVSAFAAGVDHAGERELLHRLAECFDQLKKLSPATQDCARRVMGHILDGMTLDLRRFPTSQPLRSLTTDVELDEYTWLVAGCVGEFWTDICALELPGVFRESPETMKTLGGRYGKGLQLINILRDQPGDAVIGRCYLPEESLRQAGLEGSVLWPAADWSPWHTVRRDLIARTRFLLADGWQYAASLRSTRLRFAILMPLLIGEGTLARLESLPPGGPPEAVKITRREVKRLARKALWMALTNRITPPAATSTASNP